MAQYSNVPDNYQVFPNYTYCTISSFDKKSYLSFEMWNSAVYLTFKESRDKNSEFNIEDLKNQIKLSMPVDRIMVLHEILYNINYQRINSYREGKEYIKISNPIKINLYRAGQKQQVESDPFILIYTKEIENVERVCIKGVDGTNEKEVILATADLTLAVSDPDRLANIDLTDIVLSKLVYQLKNLPMVNGLYKLMMSVFNTFIGRVRKDRETGKIYKEGFNNRNSFNPHFQKTANIEMATVENDDDVPF